MVQTRKNYHVAITATSRPPRQKERDGIDYIFLSVNVFREMIKRGIYLPPSQFEAWFLSAAHTDRDIQKTLDAAKAAMSEVARKIK